MYPCNTTPMTSKQLPQHCLLQDTLRKIAWPKDLPLMEKLYGDLAAPRSMVAFVKEVGVSVRL